MKCVCGYEKGGHWDSDINEWVEVNKYGEKFITTELVVKYEADGNYSLIQKEETVYACPECGTLKIEL